jgi:hypothetical protein
MLSAITDMVKVALALSQMRKTAFKAAFWAECGVRAA